MATRAERAVQVKLPGDVPVWVKPGDWIITSGEQVIDVVDDSSMGHRYEDVIDGTLLPRATCTQIEAITGIGTTMTPGKLLNAIDRLAHIGIGGIKIEFTPGQMEELKHRAAKRGQTVQQAIEQVVDRVKDEIFYKT